MPSHASFTDRQALRERAYADERALETRRSIYQYRRPYLDLVAEVIAQVSDAPPGLAIDVGCGSGVYTKALRAKRGDHAVLALDLSNGMIAAAGQPGTVADAERLPLRDNSCAIAMALHMLYHVPDPGAAVAELARVCFPGGRVVLAGNAADDKAEFNAVWDTACAEVPGAAERFRTDDLLTLADMADLARCHFQSVTMVDFVGETVVPDSAPVVAWLESTRALRGVDDPTFDAIMDRATNYVDRQIVHTGGFRLTSHVGLVVAQC